jgi:DnaD/phage-associated family protein
MAKDPAVLLYTDDFLAGTITMTNAQVGAYARLLFIQHQQGHLTEEKMLSICKKRDPIIWSKFIQDENGLFFNRRMELETEKRAAYSDSRSKNKKGKTKQQQESHENHMISYDTPYENHMGNGNVIINKSIIHDDSTGNEETVSARVNDLSMVMTLYLDRINAEPSMNCIGMLKSYTEDLGGDVVCRAIEIAIDAKAPAWSYIKPILQNWTRLKVKTIDDVERIEAERKKNKGGSNGQSVSQDTAGSGRSKRELPGVTKL